MQAEEGRQSFSSFLAKGVAETGLGAASLWLKHRSISTVTPGGEDVGATLGLF